MSEKSKWFEPAQKPLPAAIVPVSSATAAQLDDLMEAMEYYNVADATQQLFQGLCEIPPPQRLTRNFKVLATEMASRHTTSVLRDITSDYEYNALCHLAAKGVDPAMQAVAYALLNIEERMHMQSSLIRLYNVARSQNSEYLRSKATARRKT